MSSVFGKKPSGARLERVKASKQFKNGRFENTVPVTSTLEGGTAFSTMGEYFFGGQDRTPPGPLPTVDPREAWLKKAETGLRATWLGHSTVLLEIDGVRVMTDPVFSLRASPFQFAGPKRFHAPPVTLEQVGKLDAVVVSHDHYDHLDMHAIETLVKMDVPIFTSLGVGAHFEAWGVRPERIFELDWWESAPLPGTSLRVTATPARHFSGRRPDRNNTTLWSSLVLQGEKHQVFFSGDTGPTDEFKDIHAKFGKFDLVMLEVGAFHPSWGSIHLGPDKAAEALEMLGGGAFLPVHWGTFNLAIHAWDDPLETLTRLAPQRSMQLLTPRLGAPVEPSRPPAVDPWWRAVAASGKHSVETPPPVPVQES